MTTQMELNHYEKRLLELAKADDTILRYRKSMVINSILYSMMFTVAVYVIDWSQRTATLYYLIAGILAVYSLLSGFAVINFQRALPCHSEQKLLQPCRSEPFGGSQKYYSGRKNGVRPAA